MNADTDVCPACHGTGQYVLMQPVQPYRKIDPPKECSRCGGTGKKLKPVPILSKMQKARRTRRGV
jgi:DnaJ-class molecular chaperone